MPKQLNSQGKPYMTWAERQKRKRAKFEAKDPEAAALWKKRQQRAARLKKVYGLEYADYERLYAIQGGRCAICRDPHEWLSVDHCHTTNQVRSLLCGWCNSAVGFIREDPLRAAALVRYLEDRCVPTKRKSMRA